MGKSLKRDSAVHSASYVPDDLPRVFFPLEMGGMGQDGHPEPLPSLVPYEAVTCLKQVASCDEGEVRHLLCEFSQLGMGRGH